MITTIFLTSLAGIPCSQSMPSSLEGVDGWQGIQAVTIPGAKARSLRLATPLTLDLALGGHATGCIQDSNFH